MRERRSEGKDEGFKKRERTRKKGVKLRSRRGDKAGPMQRLPRKVIEGGNVMTV